MDPKETEKETLDENGQPVVKPTEEGDGTPKTDLGDEEKVEITKSELDKLQKKATDFDGMIEKQKLSKLEKKIDKGEENDRVAKLEEEVASMKAENSSSNLRNAYQEFVKEMPWANDDECFSKISESFNADGLTSKDAMLAKLKATAINLFPQKFSEYKEKEIKAKALAEVANLNAGDGGHGSGNGNGVGNKQMTEEEKTEARMGALLKKNTPWLNKK